MDLNMKILVVDDFATMRRIVKNVLKQIGFTNITEVENGREAIKELKKEPYGLVLCDWNMPEMTGIEVLNQVRAEPSLKNVPFVMVTAEAQKDNIIEAVKAGVTSYVVKPFTAETIEEKLKKIFKG
jgi:two-component system chemotaxis response regulator CheY